MFFQIDNTPEHVRRARRSEAAITKKPPEEIPRLVIAPFSRPPQVVFENVCIGTTANRSLEIYNPSKQAQQIKLDKAPPGLIIQLPDEWLSLEPETCYCLSLMWTPTQPTSSRESLRFTNDNRGRFDVVVVLKSTLTIKGKAMPIKGYKISPGKMTKKKISKKSPVSIYKKKSELIYNMANEKSYTIIKEKKSNYAKADKENIDFSMNDARSDRCPFGSPNSVDFHFNTSEIFSTMRTEKENKLTSTYTTFKDINNTHDNILKPSNNLTINKTTDIFDDLAFTPLKGEIAKPKIQINCDFDDSIELKSDNKENQNKYNNLPYYQEWTAEKPKVDDFADIQIKKNIPNTSSPKELASLNFSINTEYSRISELSFFPPRFSTERKQIMKINDTNEFDDLNLKMNSDTYIKESPIVIRFENNAPTSYFDHRPAHSKQSLFREPAQSLTRIPPTNDMYSWSNECNLKSPARSPTPPLQSIPEEPTAFSETHVMDRTDNQFTSTFTINKTFDKFERPSLSAGRQSWSKKAARADADLWKIPTSVAKRASKPKKSLANVSKISNKSLNTTNPQNVTVNIVGNVYSQSLTVDPFSSSTYFYDEEAVDKFEKEFKRWLNCILTPPADLESNIEQKIDFGKAWIENRNKEVPLAPTKEQVCSLYHNSHRLESLRRSARALLLSQEIVQVIEKLNAQIEKKLIVIRNDRNLHLDVGLQKAIMELLLSYNPLWLRIGLEAIYGKVIPLKSNSDIDGLTIFIIQRMFKNPYLKNKHSKSNAPNMLLPAYMESLKKFTLKKFFVLVFFLDQAKQRKLISHDPCLFCRNAVCKESREIIIRFTRELIAGIGDITKHLRPLGYVVCHKQSYLDEYKYAVNNIAIDIRDGVRITKVMEIILMKNNLLKQLRTPAISRLQKIHNVQVALNALKEANFVIEGDISASDIADGHREKTLSFLWQIIHVFRAPLFVQAANVIQAWWRKKYEVILAKRLEEERLHARLNNAASVIQCWWRRIQYSRYVDKKMKQVVKATVVIQKYCRMWLCRTRLLKIKKSVLLIEDWYISVKIMRQDMLTLVELRQEREMLRQTAATKIQSHVRTWLCSRQYKKTVTKVILLQSIIRCFLQRESYRKLKESVIKMQRRYRGKLEMKKCMQELAHTIKSCIIIQRNYRMITQKRRYNELKQSVKTIEEKYLALIKMRQERQTYLKIKTACIKLQSLVRMVIKRSEYNRIVNSTLLIQRRFRATCQMKLEQKIFNSKQQAAIKIQAHVRGWLARKSYKDTINKIITVQTFVRRFNQRQRYRKFKQNVINIQKIYRGRLLMRKEMERLDCIKQNVILIQSYFRMYKQRKHYAKLKNAVRIIECRFLALKQMRLDRNNFLRLQRSCIKLQALFKSRKTRRQFARDKNSIVFIQRKFRANWLMKKEKQNYLTMRQSAIKIQSCFRGWVVRNNYKNTVKKIIYMQSKIRCYLAKRQFAKDKTSIVFIQRRFRANRLMKKENRNYVKMRQAAIKIQSCFRGWVVRNNYKNTVKKITYLQSKIRCYLARRQFVKDKNSIVLIQRRFRSIQLMKKENQNYLKIRQSVIKIQSCFRGWVARNNYKKNVKKIIYLQSKIRCCVARRQYLNMRQSIVYIQYKYRAKLQMRVEMKKYHVAKTSAVKIQSYFRMYRQRKQYRMIKIAVRKLEDRYIAKKLMQKDRQQYIHLKECCIKIQSLIRGRQARTSYQYQRQIIIKLQARFRATRLMRKEMLSYKRKKHAADCIKTYLRNYIAMKKQQQIYKIQYKAIVTIQKYYRNYLLTKQYREQYLKMKQAALLIQTRYRALISMRHERTSYLKLKQITTLIQNRYRAIKTIRELRKIKIERNNAALCIQKNFRRFLAWRSYTKLREYTILIQRIWKLKLLRRQVMKEYFEREMAIIRLQAFVRSYLVRKKIKAEKLEAAKKEEMKMYKAASKIQAAFRGHRVRTKLASDIRIVNLRKRWREGALQSDQESLKSRYDDVIDVLNNVYDIETVINAFKSLELITEVFPMMYNENAASVVQRVYVYMSVTNRSISSIEMLKSAASVLVNLTRYKVTGPNIYNREWITPVLKFMWRFSNSETELFNILCTYLWLFSKYEAIKQDLSNFLKTPENHKMLVTIKNNVERMRRMVDNSRNKYATQHNAKVSLNHTLNMSIRRNSIVLPATEPNYGINRPDKPQYFEDSSQAINCVFNTYHLH